jgi:hypothetical protein
MHKELEISNEGSFLTKLQALWNFPYNAAQNNKRAHPKLSASNLTPLEYVIEDLQLESHYSVILFAFQHSFKLHEHYDLCLTVHLKCRQCNKIKTN